MNGVVFLKNTREIIDIVPDVVECTEKDVIGKNARVLGINLEEANYVITDQNFEVGDELPEDIEDQRGKFQSLSEVLQEENALLALELAQTQLRLEQAEQEQAALLLELVNKGVL